MAVFTIPMRNRRKIVPITPISVEQVSENRFLNLKQLHRMWMKIMPTKRIKIIINFTRNLVKGASAVTQSIRMTSKLKFNNSMNSSIVLNGSNHGIDIVLKTAIC